MNHKKPNDASSADSPPVHNSAESKTSLWDEEDVIFSYSRAQALDDGVLMDAEKLAAEAGFRYPVALTHAAWATCVTVPDDAAGQDEVGRLWDVLMCLKCATKKTGGSSVAYFDVLVRQSEKELIQVGLKAVCHPGDHHEPVMTIMLPDED